MKEHWTKTGRDRVREAVRKRDNYTCQKCNKKWVEGMRRFDVHHLKDKDGSMSRNYDGMEYALTEGNMITMCHKCHLNEPSERLKMIKGIKNYYRCRKKKLSTGVLF